MKNIDYEAVCLTELSTNDFENPFLTLRQMFEETPVEDLQEECWEIFTLAFRSYYWMKYGSPLEAHRKYKKILRLLEIGWLIYNIRPSYSTRGIVSETFPSENDMLSIKELEGPIEGNNVYKLLIKLYNENMLLCYKMDLFDIMLVGLNMSSERGESNISEVLLGRFKELNALIKVLHSISLNESDQKIIDADEVVLKQIEIYQAKSNGCLIYDSDLRDIIGRYTSKEDLLLVLKSSEFILYQDNYWKWHNNPGNVIYYFQHFLFMLEIFWLHVSKNDGNIAIEKARWNIPEERARNLFGICNEEVEQPWEYLKDRFNAVPISQWRHNLREWQEALLSNKEFNYSDTLKFRSLQKVSSYTDRNCGPRGLPSYSRRCRMTILSGKMKRLSRFIFFCPVRSYQNL